MSNGYGQSGPTSQQKLSLAFAEEKQSVHALLLLISKYYLF